MTNTDRPRAGCYLRISSDPKDRREGVDRQREDTSALCEVKGWTIVDTYVDNDRSASNGKDRPEWDRLLADIKAGKVDAIAAWDQDRGWRMMHELESLRRFFTDLGRPVALATTGQGDVDLYSPTGVLTAQIKTAVSEHEIAMMKVRMRRAARQKAERGEPKWRNAFGFLRDGSRTPDPATAPLVKQAYVSILSGGSISDIAREWNAAGMYGLKGRPWTPTTVSLFLRKPRNAGLREHNGEIVGPGTWPPLVDEETWKATLAVLNAPERLHPRRAVRNHVLTGVLWCGREGCDGRLGAHWVYRRTGGEPGRPKAGETKAPSGHTIPVLTYACKSCHRVGVRAEHVEPLVYAIVAGRLAEPDAVDLLRATRHDAAVAEELRAEKQALYAQIRQAEAEYDDGIIDGRRLASRKERVAEKLDAIERRQMDQERLRVFDGLPLGTPEVAEKVRALSPDRFRAVIDVLVEFVVAPVGKGGKVFNPERVQVNWK